MFPWHGPRKFFVFYVSLCCWTVCSPTQMFREQRSSWLHLLMTSGYSQREWPCRLRTWALTGHFFLLRPYLQWNAGTDAYVPTSSCWLAWKTKSCWRPGSFSCEIISVKRLISPYKNEIIISDEILTFVDVMMLFMDKILHPICRGRPYPKTSDRLQLKLKKMNIYRNANFDTMESQPCSGPSAPFGVQRSKPIWKQWWTQREDWIAWGSNIVEVALWIQDCLASFPNRYLPYVGQECRLRPTSADDQMLSTCFTKWRRWLGVDYQGMLLWRIFRPGMGFSFKISWKFFQRKF